MAEPSLIVTCCFVFGWYPLDIRSSKICSFLRGGEGGLDSRKMGGRGESLGGLRGEKTAVRM